jgi:hypothetical protein
MGFGPAVPASFYGVREVGTLMILGRQSGVAD